MMQLGGLEILVCNAGVYGPKGPIQDILWSEWSHAIAINVMGTVLPCREVLPYFVQQRYGKIIILSGGGATKPLPYLSAYAASKAAAVRFSETLAEEVRGLGIDVNSVAPGALNTRLLDEVLEAGPDKVGHAFYEQSLRQKEAGGTPLDRGAALSVFLASSSSDGITGKLISAVWDPWETLPEHSEDLKDSDIYTLRRIVPRDRGKDWG
jgi:3-oxoacyl-[acyl-carrier protein] reductase